MNNKTLGKLTKQTYRTNYSGDHDNINNSTPKRSKLKHITVKKKLLTRIDYNQNVPMSILDFDNLKKPYSQGSIVKSHPSPKLAEVVILSVPGRSIVKIIDADTETPIQDVTGKNDFKRMQSDLKSKREQNTQIIESYHFLF